MRQAHHLHQPRHSGAGEFRCFAVFGAALDRRCWNPAHEHVGAIRPLLDDALQEVAGEVRDHGVCVEPQQPVEVLRTLRVQPLAGLVWLGPAGRSNAARARLKRRLSVAALARSGVSLVPTGRPSRGVRAPLGRRSGACARAPLGPHAHARKVRCLSPSRPTRRPTTEARATGHAHSPEGGWLIIQPCPCKFLALRSPPWSNTQRRPGRITLMAKARENTQRPRCGARHRFSCEWRKRAHARTQKAVLRAMTTKTRRVRTQEA